MWFYQSRLLRKMNIVRCTLCIQNISHRKIFHNLYLITLMNRLRDLYKYDLFSFSCILFFFITRMSSSSLLNNVCYAGVEAMTDMSGSGKQQFYKQMIASILSLIIAIVIVAFVGQWLWNCTVVELFTFVRPVRSAWQIIGLMLLVSLFR